MAKSALKVNNTTQKFIEIIDIKDGTLFMTGGNASLIIEVQATNFALLSADEQDAKLFSYGALLNSLSFSIQVLIRSKKVDVTNYLESLHQEALKSKNPELARQINLYRDFVTELVKVNVVLDKKFYIIIPFSTLEKGITGVKSAAVKGSGVDEDLMAAARASLRSKAESLLTQLQRLNLRAKILEEEELIALFHDIYNDSSIEAHQQIAETTSDHVIGKK